MFAGYWSDIILNLTDFPFLYNDFFFFGVELEQSCCKFWIKIYLEFIDLFRLIFSFFGISWGYEGKYKKGKQYGIGRITNEKGQKQIGLYLKGKRLKILNEKDFKEDIKNIDKEIEKINNIINENEFFKKNLEKLTITQGQYFDNTPE